MTKNEIKLQYSGFMMFTARIISVVTGMMFTLMLTRSTTEPQFGVWSNVNDIIAYFALLAAAFPFWALRFVARNEKSAVKTGVIGNLITSLIAATIYVPLIPIIMSLLGISEIYTPLYVVAAIYVVELYLTSMLESCLRAKMPQTVGYGILIGEVFKVLLAYVIIIQFQQPLIGALLSLVGTACLQIVYYLKLLRRELFEPIEWSYLKEWLKGSTINIYYFVGDRIAAFVFIMLFAYGGQDARGYYLAAATIANIITYSSVLSFALYPKLLMEKNTQDITSTLKIVLMFAIPMTIGVLAMPDSYLTILKEGYKEATPLLMVLAVNAFVQTVSQFFSPVLFGLEEIDEQAEIPFKKLARSPLFKAFTLPYVHSAITLPTTFYVLTTFVLNDPLMAAFYVGVIDTIARSVTLIILFLIIRKMVTLNIPWNSLAKYVSASAVMGIILYLIPHPERLVLTFAVTFVGAAVYITLLTAIDKEARELVKSILQQMKLKFE